MALQFCHCSILLSEQLNCLPSYIMVLLVVVFWGGCVCVFLWGFFSFLDVFFFLPLLLIYTSDFFLIFLKKVN